MEPLDRLDKQSILAEEVFEEIFSQEDETKRARLIISLEDRAVELGVKTKFGKLLNAYQKVDRQMQKKQRSSPSILDNWTNFDGPYDRMYCGSWIASDDGIYSQNTGTADILACRHPILPIERLKNLETDNEKMKLAYKRNGRWFEKIVSKDILSSANKIISLYQCGISVTSENARCLVKYLQDIEDLNDDHINIQYSTTKLGWIKNGFVPYDDEVIFDGDAKFRRLFDSVRAYGSRTVWYEHMKKLRSSNRIEIKFMLAASFASVLLHVTDNLPFFVDLWGITEGGKTITLMLAASVWACPDEHAYMKDYKSSDVGLEVICDVLNHLPLILDDTSKKDKKIEENFEGIVYNLCSGKGKTRSNKDLGSAEEKLWHNIILTNGERPLNSYVSQGGAINRILELECGTNVYEDPQETVEILKGNYGYAGKEFVDVVKKLGKEKIIQIQKEYEKSIYSDEKMQKQSQSLAIVLAADRIATDYLFQDGQYIDIKEAKEVLVDRNELSDNERCYQYIRDKVAMNQQRFDMDTTCEKWGIIEDGYAIFYNQAFEQLCKEAGFSKKSFLSWADRKGLIQTQGDQPTKIKKIAKKPKRCVWLKLDDTVDSEGFQSIDDAQEELPFK